MIDLNVADAPLKSFNGILKMDANGVLMVAVLTQEQGDSINGVVYDNYGQVFNVVLDNFDNLVVSEIEINNSKPEFNWLRALPLIEYVPKEYLPWF